MYYPKLGDYGGLEAVVYIRAILGVRFELVRLAHANYKSTYSGTSVIRHLDNPEHLYNPTQNFGLNGGLH